MSATVVKVQDTDARIVNSVLWTEENGQELIDSVNTLETESVKSVNNRTVTAGTNNVTVDAVHIFATHEGTNSTVQEALDLTNDRIDTVGAGSVGHVNGKAPDVNGNVSVTDVFTFLGEASDFVSGTTFQGKFIQRSPSGGTQPNMYYNATDISYICTTLGISCCRIIHDFQGTSAMYEGRMDSETFIYYPIAEVPQVLNDYIIGYTDAENVSLPLEGKINAMVTKARLLVGINSPFEISFRCTAASHPSLDLELDELIYTKFGRNVSGLAYVFRVVVSTSTNTTSTTLDCTNRCYLEFIDGTTYMFVFDYDNFANVQVRDVTGERTIALDLYELGFVETDFGAGITLDQVIEKIELRVLEYLGTYRNWSISQRIWDDATSGYWRNIVEAYRSKLASIGGWNPVAPGFYDLEMKSTSRNHVTDGSHILIRFYDVISHNNKYHQFYFDRNLVPQVYSKAFNELHIDKEGNYVRTDVSSTINNADLEIYGGLFRAGPYEGSSAAFEVDPSTGHVGMQTPSANPAYYVKKGTNNNTTDLSVYSTLRMGDMAMVVRDAIIEGTLPNTKQVSNIDFGVPTRQNAEGEDCIFLLDIIEKMHNEIQELKETSALLEERVSALEGM